MSPHEEEATREVQKGANEDNEENSVRFSPHLVAERIKASPETLHAVIFNLTEMMALRWSPLYSRQRHHLPPWDTWPIMIYSNEYEFRRVHLLVEETHCIDACKQSIRCNKKKFRQHAGGKFTEYRLSVQHIKKEKRFCFREN